MPLHQLLIDTVLFLPEIFFLTTTILLLLWSLFLTTATNINKLQVTVNVVPLLIGVLSITAILLGKNLNKKKLLFYESLSIDNYSSSLKIALILLTIIFLVIAQQSIAQNFPADFEFPLLIAFSVFSMLVLASSNDLITFYLSIEMQSLCLYVLAAFKRTSQFSLEAGLKYFVLGALSSSLLLFGMSLIYGFTGSTSFTSIRKLLATTLDEQVTPYTLKLGFIFLLCGFLFKLTAVPFHVWSPDVYEGSPLTTTVFFSTIPKLAIFSIFIKLIFSTFFNLHYIWQPILFNSAAITVIFASLAALYQKKIKRFLAYSSIGHIGYMLIGLSTGTLVGLHSFFLYITTYIITMFAFFGLLLSIKKTANRNLIYITDLLFLKNIHPLSKLGFILILFSMAGIPPLLGFFSKFYIFFAAIESHYYLLVTLGVLSSTLSAFYYIRIIKIINFEKIVNLNFTKVQITTSMITWALFSLLFIIFFIISPNLLIIKTYQLTLLV